MLREKESIQGMEHKSQHLLQVSKIILFVLNVFSPLAALPVLTSERGGYTVVCTV